MPILRNILRNVLSDTSNCCYLCFNAIGENETAYNIKDEVFMGIEIGTTKVLHGMICTVLGCKVLDIISAHNIICQKCTGMVINCYKFIQQCKQNIEQLNCAIESLQKHTQKSVDNNDYKSLFVALDTSKYKVDLYYDKHRNYKNQTLLHKRFQGLHKDSQYIKKSAVKIRTQRSILGSIALTDIVHDKDDLSNLKCKVCSKTYLSVVQMKYHYLSTHATEKFMLDKGDLSNLKCKVCSKVYLSEEKMKYHYLSMHAAKKFKCSECPRGFGSSILLKNHISNSHCNVICSHCGKTFNSIYSLRTHEALHSLTPLVCQTCGKSYRGKRSFDNHITNKMCHKKRNTNAEAKFCCSYCGKKYTHGPALNVHVRIEHEDGKAVICNWCGKKFSCNSRLQDHVVTHTKQKNFECSQCGGKFVSKMSLLYHTRRHTGEKPYKCEICDRSFLSASRRSEHVKRQHVHDSSEIECDICHSSFKGSKSLANHRSKHFDVRSRLYVDRSDSAVLSS